MDSQGTQRRDGKFPAVSGITNTDAQQLKSRVDRLEKQVQEYLAEKNQWSATVRGWIAKVVSITLLTGSSVEGELVWVDRYTLGIKELGASAPTVVHKGAVAIIRQAGRQTP